MPLKICHRQISRWLAEIKIVRLAVRMTNDIYLMIQDAERNHERADRFTVRFVQHSLSLS